jgi:hypothetical protein
MKFGWELLYHGSLVGRYPTRDAAMCMAQEMQMMRPDGTLDDGHTLRLEDAAGQGGHSNFQK